METEVGTEELHSALLSQLDTSLISLVECSALYKNAHKLQRILEAAKIRRRRRALFISSPSRSDTFKTPSVTYNKHRTIKNAKNQRESPTLLDFDTTPRSWRQPLTTLEGTSEEIQ